MAVLRKYCFVLGVLLLPLSLFGQEVEVIGSPTDEPGPFLVEGIVVDFDEAEPLVGATVFVEEIRDGTITDENGKFQLRLDKGYYTFKVSFIGYEPRVVNTLVRGEGIVQVLLKEDLVQMEEVLILSTKPDANVRGATLGKASLSIESIEALPPFAGEFDVLKSILLLPGISSVGEASSGFNVRGGSVDQNLILLGGAPLYNPSHLFGFFSAFNSDVIRDVTVYKGGIPGRYGGRGSSIVDLMYKSGDLGNWGGKASVGTTSAKLALNGPIVENKLSVYLAGRVSFANWMLRLTDDPQVSNSAAAFYDVNAIVNYFMNTNNSFSYAFYRSHDDFKFVNDTSYAWNNTNHVLSWNHNFNERLRMSVSGVRSEYEFLIKNRSGFDDFDVISDILDQGLNIDFNQDFSDKSLLSFGVQTKLVEINPGELKPRGISSIVPFSVENERALESGIYFQHDLELGQRVGFSYGLRYSNFNYLGSRTVNSYEQYQPRNEENIIDQTTFGTNEVIQSYDGFEPRVSARYSFNETTSVKAGFNRINQYIHLISNTTSIAPTDIWKLSDPYLKPQTVTQYSIGFFKNFNNNTIETSLEGYYKDQGNLIEYKDGAELVLNPHLETELLNGRGYSYGIELYLRRKVGVVRGWVSYTYSRSFRQVIGSFPEELINNGDYFPANFDKPHNLNTTLELAFNPRVRFSSILTYSTGRPITFPAAKFLYQGNEIAYFTERNGKRAPDYMRVDVSFTFALNGQRKIFGGDLVLSVFNLLGRKNAFSVFFNDLPGVPPEAYKLSILGTPFPTISYSFEF